MKRRTAVKTLVKAAEAAARELELTLVRAADKARLARVYLGLEALDEQQAQLRQSIDRLVLEFTNPNAPEDECEALLRKLRELAVDGCRFVSVVSGGRS